MQHLVFYDGECGMCDGIVKWLLRLDKNKVFVFASLQGETAKQMLSDLNEEDRGKDSLILIENFRQEMRACYFYGKAALRICWLLGGGWKLLGSLSFLPAYLFDWGYRLVARNRYRLFGKKACTIPGEADRERFLK